MVQEKENTNRPLALILTVIIHVVLFLIFWLVVFKTPIPPFPLVGGGGGLEVNFGNSANGMGSKHPEEFIPIETKLINPQSARSAKSSKEDNIMTDVNGESVAIKTNNKNKKKDNSLSDNTKQSPQIQINDPVVNPNAIYKKRVKNSGEGETGQPGIQGKLNGNPNSSNYTGDGGSGGGTGGGIGTGNGPGEGPGSGPGSGGGKGISFYLTGRKQLYLPTPPKINLEHQETVVVKIWVDRDGNVVRQMAGERGTSTTNPRLVKIAENLASKSKFDSNPNAKEEQTGTITYIFTH